MRFLTNVEQDMMNIHYWLADEDQRLPNMFNKTSVTSSSYPVQCAISSQSSSELDTYQMGTKFHKNPPSYEEHMKRYTINQSLGSTTPEAIKTEYQSIGNFTHSQHNQTDLMEPYHRESRNMCYPCKYRIYIIIPLPACRRIGFKYWYISPVIEMASFIDVAYASLSYEEGWILKGVCTSLVSHPSILTKIDKSELFFQ